MKHVIINSNYRHFCFIRSPVFSHSAYPLIFCFLLMCVGQMPKKNQQKLVKKKLHEKNRKRKKNAVCRLCRLVWLVAFVD